MRSILYSAYLRASGQSDRLAFFSSLRRSQFDPPHETERKHLARLAGMLRFSLDHVAYYRENFDRLGLGAADIDARPVEALRALPLLDKSTLRARFDDLKVDRLEAHRWSQNLTGGSTGEPVTLLQDSLHHQAGMAGTALFDEWSGHLAGMPKVVLWGSERDLLVGKESLRSRFGAWLRNDHPLNTFRMSEKDMARYVDVINDVRPTQVLAYVEAAYELARFVEREGIRIHSPNSVMTSAGTLYPHMREVIEHVFQAPVFNRYGSREVANVACECDRHSGLHVNPYTHHLEILREDGSPCAPCETGEFVVTLLTNQVMPLLRYRIGDMGSWADQACECGRSWPMLKEVYGRINSIIRTREGTFASAALTTLLYYKEPEKKKPFASFGRYQLVQQDLDRFLLKVVVLDAPLWEEDERPRILEKLHRTLGHDVHITIERVPEIEPSASGKYQFIWSEVE